MYVSAVRGLHLRQNKNHLDKVQTNKNTMLQTLTCKLWSVIMLRKMIQF